MERHPATELVLFEFDGAQFPVIRSDTPSGQALAVAPICRHLGIDAEGQRQVIATRSWAQGMTCETQVMLPDETRSYSRFCIDIRRFAMWMATIQTGKLSNPVARERIELWQNTAADALDEYLRTGSVQPQAAPRVPTSFAEALELAASQARMLEHAVAELEVASPKAEAHDRLIAHGQDRLVRDIAKELGVMEGVLREKLLTEWRWIFRTTTQCGANQYNPYAAKMEYFSLREREAPHRSRENCWHATLYITPAGREAMRRKLAQESLEPAAAQAPTRKPTEAEVLTLIRRGA
ncbi:phage antirepressor N-terminal domain-containing protein [Streptomyces sp. NPDC001089]